MDFKERKKLEKEKGCRYTFIVCLILFIVAVIGLILN